MRVRASSGFSLIELIVVIIVLGVLATVALPRMTGALGVRNDAYRDTAVAGLRLANATAVGHRRLVCASFDANGKLSLRIAAANPASACSNNLPSPDGSTVWVTPPAGMTVVGTPSTSLYFHADGSVTATGTGSITDFSLVPTGMGAITVRGSDGLVE